MFDVGDSNSTAADASIGGQPELGRLFNPDYNG